MNHHNMTHLIPVLAFALLHSAAPSPPARAPAAEKATLVVRLPPDATLTIDAAPTAQKRAERLFETPALAPGQTYTYSLTATWTENGLPRRETRQVLVRAGERTEIDFAVPRVRSRTFLFTYACAATGLVPGKAARVWLPVPGSDEDQDVQIVRKELPGDGRFTLDPQYGNQILYVEAPANSAGRVGLSITYRVTRREARGERPAKEDAARLARLLLPDGKGPTDGKPLTLLRGQALPAEQVALARVLYDTVNTHMRYSKEGIGWGAGDVLWACDSRYGNCSDFHCLFVALARSQRLPAKFEIGFPLPEARGAGEVAGYHC